MKTLLRIRAALLAVAVLFTVPALTHQQARAEVFAFGDVTPDEDPDLPVFGGEASGPIIVGDESAGLLTVDVPATTDPLLAESITLGNTQTGVGQITVIGFTSEVRAAGGDLIVGESGQGFLDIAGGGIAGNEDESDGMGGTNPGTAGKTVLGNGFGSYGEVTVDGIFSRLETGDLQVGFFGQGLLTVSNRGTVVTNASTGAQENESGIGVQNGGDGRVRVTGEGSKWIVTSGDGGFDLDIGTPRGNGDDNNGHGRLEIYDRGVVQVGEINTDTPPDGFQQGEVLVNELGFVDLQTQGQLITEDLTNNGVIRGDGVVLARDNFVNNGEIRNAAGVANQREYLLLGDANTTLENNNLIESIGGEMEFLSAVDNTVDGDIIGRDAILRFQNGITSMGEIGLAGDTTIYGALELMGGDLFFFEDSTVVFRGSITADATSTISTVIGGDEANIDVVGGVTLTDPLGVLSVSAGTNPQPGDMYDVIVATDPIVGTFSNPSFTAGGVNWVFDYSDPNRVTAVAAAAVNPMGPDANGDGFVDGSDIDQWEANFPIASGATAEQGDADGDGDVDIFDLLVMQGAFGMPFPIVAAVAAVPEPAAAVLVLLGLGFTSGRRGRRG
ncbi:MAG: PEP-CTERM sorting domain-containing protein [Planctomycetota bacterium]